VTRAIQTLKPLYETKEELHKSLSWQVNKYYLDYINLNKIYVKAEKAQAAGQHTDANQSWKKFIRLEKKWLGYDSSMTEKARGFLITNEPAVSEKKAPKQVIKKEVESKPVKVTPVKPVVESKVAALPKPKVSNEPPKEAPSLEGALSWMQDLELDKIEVSESLKMPAPQSQAVEPVVEQLAVLDFSTPEAISSNVLQADVVVEPEISSDELSIDELLLEPVTIESNPADMPVLSLDEDNFISEDVNVAVGSARALMKTGKVSEAYAIYQSLLDTPRAVEARIALQNIEQKAQQHYTQAVRYEYVNISKAQFHWTQVVSMLPIGHELHTKSASKIAWHEKWSK
jgi:hypothetical protein